MFRPAFSIFAVPALLVMLCIPSRTVAAGMDGIIMQGGKIMMMKNGRAREPMTASMTMSNGAIVMPNGTVKQPGGTEIRMKDGQMAAGEQTFEGESVPAAKTV